MLHIVRKHSCTGHRASLYGLAPGRDRRHVLSAGGDGWIVEWDLDHPETGQVIASVDTQVYALCSVPAEDLVVAGNMNGGVHWIRPNQPQLTRNIQHHHKGVYDILAVGDSLFTAGGDGLLTRWDRAMARTVESFQLSNRPLRCIAYSATRSELAVGASDGHIYFLDAETLALKNTRRAAHEHSVFTLAYSPDQRCLLSGGRDAMLRVWDLGNDCALVSEQPAHWFTINHIVFSPDGTCFATASRDKTIRIWESASFQPLQTLDAIRDGGHINSVNRLLWLPGTLVSCSDDRTVALWEV